MRKIVGGIGAGIMVAVSIAAFMAYFVYDMNPTNNVIHDGFGRPLSECPFLIRLIFEEDRLWAGWLWFVGDMVIFWGGLLIGFTLANWGFEEP